MEDTKKVLTPEISETIHFCIPVDLEFVYPKNQSVILPIFVKKLPPVSGCLFIVFCGCLLFKEQHKELTDDWYEILSLRSEDCARVKIRVKKLLNLAHWFIPEQGEQLLYVVPTLRNTLP